MGINGEHLIGFSDFFSDSVGAADRGYGEEIGALGRPQLKQGKAPVPGGKGGGKTMPLRPYPKGKRSKVIEYHGKVLHKSKDVANKAVATVMKAVKLIAQKPSATLPLAKKIAGRPVHVGAVAAAKMSPKAKLAVQKHNAAVVKAAQQRKVLAQHTLATKKKVAELAKKMVAQKKLAKRLRTPTSRRTRVGELLSDPMIGQAVADALGEYYDAVGADPDPANPGFLTDGSPDPAFSSGDDTGVPVVDDTFDSGTELPPPPSMDTFIPDMMAVGGIAYDGSKGTPDGYAGSYGLFTRSTDYYKIPSASGVDGTEHYGFVWSKFEESTVPNGLPYGGDLGANMWNHVGGPGSNGRHDIFISGPMSVGVQPGEAFTSAQKNNPYGKSYGPLVGNPGMKDFANMRVDAAGNMFWLPQEAPDWLTFPIKQAAALTAQAAKKAEEEAAKAAAAAEKQARADEAAAQAAQDAANALAESQAASEAKVAQTQEETKQAQAETEAQTALVQQQQADTAAQAIETEQMKQAGELMLAEAKRQSDYFAQHPEEEFGPQAQMADAEEAPEMYLEEGEPPMPGMEEGNGGEGEYDDGAPVPGGDIMLDADGEGFVDG